MRLSIILLFLLPSILTAQEKINWISVSEVQELIKDDPKDVFMFIYTDWCGYCKKMEANTFVNKNIIKYINDNYHAVKFNAESTDTIEFLGKKYMPGTSGEKHRLALKLAVIDRAIGFPTLVFFNNQFQLYMPATRGNKSVEKLEMYLRFIGEDIYKSKSFDSYKTTFKSQFAEK